MVINLLRKMRELMKVYARIRCVVLAVCYFLETKLK